MKAMIKRDPTAKPPGRNDPCWCESGKKYKRCHLDADEEARRALAAKAKKKSPPPEEDAPAAPKGKLPPAGAGRGIPAATNKRPHKKTRK